MKRGYKLSKTWRLKNTGRKAWPIGTRLITPSPETIFSAQKLEFEVKPDYIVEIVMILTIPDIQMFHEKQVQTLDKENKLIKLKFNLITKEDLIIGSDLTINLHYNDTLFDEIEKLDANDRKSY